MAAKRDPYFSRAVGKAFAALRLIDDQPRSLAELTVDLKITKASAFRLLHTLEQLGEICRDAGGRYLQRPEFPAPHAALHALSQEFRETVSMAVFKDNHIEVVAVIDSPQLIRMGNIPGRILPPHASSLGKAVTAFQPPAIQQRLLRAYGTPAVTARTVTDERELKKEFALIRKQGYAEDREESTLGGVCMAAPVLRDGSAIAAVSISMPKERCLARRKMIASLRGAAAQISAEATTPQKSY